MAGAAIGFAIAGFGPRTVMRQRDERFEADGGRRSFREVVDRDEVTRVKRTDGEVDAIQHVRSRFPNAPLSEVTQLVREL